MRLELFEEDLRPEFRHRAISLVNFDWLTEEAKVAVTAVGQGFFFRSQEASIEKCRTLYPPEMRRKLEEGRAFQIGKTFWFAAQIPDDKVGCSGSRCSNCEDKTAYCVQICRTCGLPFVGPFGFPQWLKWQEMTAKEKRAAAEEVYSSSKHGRLGYTNVRFVPLTQVELAEIEALPEYEAHMFTLTHEVRPAGLRQKLRS